MVSQTMPQAKPSWKTYYSQQRKYHSEMKASLSRLTSKRARESAASRFQKHTRQKEYRSSSRLSEFHATRQSSRKYPMYLSYSEELYSQEGSLTEAKKGRDIRFLSKKRRKSPAEKGLISLIGNHESENGATLTIAFENTWRISSRTGPET